MPGPKLVVTKEEGEESFARMRLADHIVSMRVIKGGRLKEPPRPLVRMAKVVGWVALALFALALLSNCAPKAGNSCCLQGHEEPDTWLMPMDVENDTVLFIPMDGTTFVCDLRGTRNDAGECR